MNFTRKIAAAGLLVAALAFTGCGSSAEIGYVDGSKVMNEAPQIKAIMDEGSKKIEEATNAASADFENHSEWTEEEQAKAQADLQRKIIGINQAYATQLQHKIEEALAVISQEKNLDVVIDSSATDPIIHLGGVDVTAELIQKLQ